MHGGTFTLKSKLRIGTEIIVTFPPERVMSALAPMAEEAPPLQPAHAADPAANESRRLRNNPIMNAGTGLLSMFLTRRAAPAQSGNRLSDKIRLEQTIGPGSDSTLVNRTLAE